MNFKPLGERVLVERTEVENKTASGIIIPLAVLFSTSVLSTRTLSPSGLKFIFFPLFVVIIFLL